MTPTNKALTDAVSIAIERLSKARERSTRSRESVALPAWVVEQLLTAFETD